MKISAVFISSVIIGPLLYFALARPVSAEVWLSNRYAQNCSACHSPSRRNLPTKDRRCTLSCQGCHVNPNGGGLRSEYGVWTQQRWLRSAKSDFWKHKGTPAPLKYQKYGNQPKNMSAAKTTKKRGKKSTQPDWNQMAKDGPPLVVTAGVDYDEKDHDYYDNEWKITAKSRTEFLARLTEDDPWRIERKKSFFGGVDFRYFYLSGEKKSTVNTEWGGTLVPMALDVGVKWRPRPENISLVLEHRYLNGPIPDGLPNSGGQASPENIFTGASATSQVRSAYILIDDLPYATYAMYGLYRPMFGHLTPDHTTLLNHLITADNRNGAGFAFDDIHGQSARILHKALTMGGSPNVPFANLHYIMPVEDEAFLQNYKFARDRGFALNLGGRFVTLGASFMLSWWSTKGPRAAGEPDLKTDMLGISGGMAFKKLILNWDMSTIEREYQPGDTDKGNVNTVELKYRLWRENYLLLNYATSNVARNLKPGEASETMMGIKSFLYPGMEVELMMVSRHDRTSGGADAKTDLLQGQLHLFF